MPLPPGAEPLTAEQATTPTRPDGAEPMANPYTTPETPPSVMDRALNNLPKSLLHLALSTPGVPQGQPDMKPGETPEDYNKRLVHGYTLDEVKKNIGDVWDKIKSFADHPADATKEAFAEDPAGTALLPILGAKAVAGKGFEMFRSGAAEKPNLISDVHASDKDLTSLFQPKNPVKFVDDLQTSTPILKKAEEIYGPINSGNIRQVLEDTKASTWKQLQDWMGPSKAAGATVDGGVITQEMKDAIPLKLRTEKPALAKRLDAIADQWNRPFHLSDMESMQRTTNAQLDKFYNSVPDVQSTTLAANAHQAVLEAQGGAIRRSVYDTVQRFSGGLGEPQELARRWGALDNLEEHTNSLRNKLLLTHEPESSSFLRSAVGTALSPVKTIARKTAGALLDKDVPTPVEVDKRITKAFKGYNPDWRETVDPSRPKTGREFFPVPPPQAPSIAGQLPAPPPSEPKPAWWSKGPATSPGPGRQIGTSIITPAPADTSGTIPEAMSGPVGEALHQNVRPRLGPAMPEKPAGAYSMPAAANQPVQDMVPVRNPETGKVTYFSKKTLKAIRDLKKTAPTPSSELPELPQKLINETPGEER